MNNSIKRAQSQACLGFAEQKNFRPLAKLKKLSLTLLLLITAATGAWASGEIVVTVTAEDLQADLSNPFTKNGVTIKCSDRMSGGVAFNELNEMSTTLGYFTKIEITNQYPEGISGINGINGFSVNGSVATWTGKASSVGLGNYSVGPVVQFVFTIEPARIDVNYNDTKTEASFQMPQYDVTATYTLKRDMTVDVAGEMADRIRIKKDGNDYQAVDATQMNPVVKDNLETNSPVTLTETTDYTLQLQKQSETDETVWTDVTALSVGNFRYKHRHVWDFSVVDGNILKAVCQNQSGDCDVPGATTTTELTLPEEIIYGYNNAAGIDLTSFNETLAGEAEAELKSVSYEGTLLNSGGSYGPTADVPKLPGEYKVTIKVSAGGHEYTVSKDFKLEQKALEMEMVTPIDNCVYNGKEHEPAVTLKYGSEVLKQGTDYVVSYVDNLNAGLGVVTIKGLGNYQGTTYATFNILDKELAGDMIAAIADQSYTGQAIEPAVVVKDGEEVLEEGRDYTVTYENNVAVGTATVIVKAGTSGNYRGEVKATFNIVGTTAILAVGGSPANTTAQRYDLSGRKINGQWSMVNGQWKKGVVIVDGKKVVVK